MDDTSTGAAERQQNCMTWMETSAKFATASKSIPGWLSEWRRWPENSLSGYVPIPGRMVGFLPLELRLSPDGSR